MLVANLPQLLPAYTWGETLDCLGGLIRAEPAGHFTLDNARFKGLLNGHLREMQAGTTETAPLSDFAEQALLGKIHALDYADLYVLTMAIATGWQTPEVEVQLVSVNEVYPEGFGETELSPLARLAIQLVGPLGHVLRGPWNAEVLDMPQMASGGAVRTWSIGEQDRTTLSITALTAWQKILEKIQQHLGLGEQDRVTLHPGVHFRGARVREMRQNKEHPASLVTRSKYAADIRRQERPLRFYLHDVYFHSVVMACVSWENRFLFDHVAQTLQGSPLLEEFPQLKQFVKKSVADFASVMAVFDDRVYRLAIRNCYDLCHCLAAQIHTDLQDILRGCPKSEQAQTTLALIAKGSRLFTSLYHSLKESLPEAPWKAKAVLELGLLATCWLDWNDPRQLFAQRAFTGSLVENRIVNRQTTNFLAT